jgi:hypothetical protein
VVVAGEPVVEALLLAEEPAPVPELSVPGSRPRICWQHRRPVTDTLAMSQTAIRRAVQRPRAMLEAA